MNEATNNAVNADLLQLELDAISQTELDPDDCKGIWFPALQIQPIGIDEGSNLHLNIQIAIPKGVLKSIDQGMTGAMILGADGKPTPPDLGQALIMAPMIRLVVKADELIVVDTPILVSDTHAPLQPLD
jgi:hypothetical protein|tara:strand:- start:204 stop:590 length:387 start_codon:yes stop_codon:yes gene_type:complete